MKRLLDTKRLSIKQTLFLKMALKKANPADSLAIETKLLRVKVILRPLRRKINNKKRLLKAKI